MNAARAPRQSAPPWFLAAVAAGLTAVESGEHGFYTVTGADLTGPAPDTRYLTDCDATGEVITGCTHDGSTDREWADIEAAILWCRGAE